VAVSSADGTHAEIVVLVVVVLVAVVEVLVPGVVVVSSVLRGIVLYASPPRSLEEETAPDLPAEPVVSLMRMAVAS
jgi:hypothetical protein